MGLGLKTCGTVLKLLAAYMATNLPQASAQDAVRNTSKGGDAANVPMSAVGLRLYGPILQTNRWRLWIEGNEAGGIYDLFWCEALGVTNCWQHVFRTGPGDTNIDLALKASPQGFFMLGTQQDGDGDGLPDAWEILSLQTDPKAWTTAAALPPQTPLLASAPAGLRISRFNRHSFAKEVFDPCEFESSERFEEDWLYKYDIYQGDQIATHQTWLESCENGFPTQFHFGQTNFFAPSPVYWGTKYAGSWESNVFGFMTNRADHSENIEFEFITGGKPLSTTIRLYRVGAAAVYVTNNWNGGWNYGPEISPTAISIQGQALDTSHHAYLLLRDNTTNNFTPSISGASNYFFALTNERMDLRIWRNGIDITDTNSIVWVGQRIELGCALDPPGSLSNFQWTVPGTAVVDWERDSNHSSVHYLSNLTSDSVLYHWVDGRAAKVTVSAEVAGHRIVGTTSFEVRRPSASFVLTPKWHVEVTRDGCVKPAGDWKLTTGRNCSSNDVGMLFEYTLDAFGFNDAFEIQFIQIATIDRKWNLDLPGVSPPHQSDEISMRGLDGSYPYAWWNNVLSSGERPASDTPLSVLEDPYTFKWVTDDFECHLMFWPRNGIPVPLSTSTWRWDGRAGPAQNGWVLYPQAIHPTPALGVDNFAYPAWTNNIANWPDFRRRNLFWLPP